MDGPHTDGGAGVVFDAEHLQRLFDALAGAGYRLIGPTVRDGALALDDVARVADLPRGWSAVEEKGASRLEPREKGAYFSLGLPAQSWKRYLSPPRERLWSAARAGGGFVLDEPPAAERPLAFVGVRPCDYRAILTLDAVFLRGACPDSLYAARRAGLFLAVVSCVEAGATCFCASLSTGPEAPPGADLALTEIVAGSRHVFVARAGTPRGADILAEIPHSAASSADVAEARAAVAHAAASQRRRIDTERLRDILYRRYDDPRWDALAARCLTCANCTLVCPTCFCSTVEDSTDLTGEHAERWRRWDSCFTLEFSYLHGGSIRQSARSRYRQWLVHKLAAWTDQFGMLGCVGCGRCITWCPVGIDLTEEVAALRRAEEERDHAHA